MWDIMNEMEVMVGQLESDFAELKEKLSQE
jgi:hypothetical protein